MSVVCCLLATLDLEVEIIMNQICYSYFQKKMKTPLVIGKKSAMSEHQKFSILTNEIIRRMSNTSSNISIEERVSIVDRFTLELKTQDMIERKQER